MECRSFGTFETFGQSSEIVPALLRKKTDGTLAQGSKYGD